MAKGGIQAVRAAFADAKGEVERQKGRYDPSPYTPRAVQVGRKTEEVAAGQWDGHPRDKLPPDCPVVPLGVDGKTAFFVDTIGQLIDVRTNEWGKKILIQLFMTTPNFLEWAWPRWSAQKGDKPAMINGLEVDEACACLLNVAGQRGLFSPTDRVRGRGAWTDDHGRLIWHAGDRLWMVDGGKLKCAPPGWIDDIFYSTRPLTIEPWPEPVAVEDSPAQDLFAALQTWSWERPLLDPLMVIGSIGAMMIGGALTWRPHLFVSGDMKVGKTELQRLIKAVLGGVLHDTANTSEAGVRQRLGLDTLPVAVDEMEATADNRRVNGIIELARLSSSGGRFFRGGQDHKGVEFLARSAFFMTAIVPPPMRSQDKSRFAQLNLDKLEGVGTPPEIDKNAGRMVLRSLLDAWGQYPQALADWKATLRDAHLDGRQQDTYGTLLAIAQLLLGDEALEEAGLPITEAVRLGHMIAAATSDERAEQVPTWRKCLEHLMGATIDAWRGGEKPTVGAVLAQLEANEVELSAARERLAAAGLGVQLDGEEGAPRGERRVILCVPKSSPALARLYDGQDWCDGGWWSAIKQGRSAGREKDGEKVTKEGVVRSGEKVVKINRVSCRCLIVDLARYDEIAGEDAGSTIPATD